MAKKQANPAEAAEKPAGTDGAEAAKAKPAKEKPEAAEKPAAEKPTTEKPAGEKKPKEPRKKEDKAKPDAGAAGATPAPAAAPAAPAPAAATPGPAPGAKKKGRQPGIPPRRGKKLRNQLKNLYQKVEKESPAPLKKAISLIKQVKRVKFDETVVIHMSLGIDPTQSDQMIRGTVALPNGVGKSERVLVFCQGDDVAKAKAAGADYAGSDELIKKIQGEGWLEFDRVLATQSMMGQVSRLGKVLGPRGLMPTPKAGTVITVGQDLATVVKEFKAGKVEYRSDKGGNVHARVGKMSFDDEKLAQNITTFVEQIRAVKPSGVKGHYIRSITLQGTMTPGVQVTM